MFELPIVVQGPFCIGFININVKVMWNLFTVEGCVSSYTPHRKYRNFALFVKYQEILFIDNSHYLARSSDVRII